MDDAQRIRRAIIAIADSGNKSPLLFTVTVKSVSGETCTVEYAGTILTGVRLSAVIDGNSNKTVLKPTQNSKVLVADLSGGQLRDLAVVSFSELDSITYFGGQLGGIPIVQKIEDNLNNLKDLVNAMHAALPTAFAAVLTGASATGPGGSTSYTTTMAGKTIVFENMEDTNIKH